MQAEDFVREARSAQPDYPAQLLQLVIYKEEPFSDDGDKGDQTTAFRAAVLKEIYKTFTANDRSLIRFLLEQEIIYHANEWAIGESIRLCGFLLFMLANLEDIHLLWNAKTANFDTMCGFDIQFLVGAGVTTTIAYLQPIQEEWAQEARTYIEECQQSGDFRDLERYSEAMHAYFRSTMDTSA